MCSTSEESFNREWQELRSKPKVCTVTLCQIRAEINLQEKTNETWLERTFFKERYSNVPRDYASAEIKSYHIFRCCLCDTFT